jgi:hypothetical protein
MVGVRPEKLLVAGRIKFSPAMRTVVNVHAGWYY